MLQWYHSSATFPEIKKTVKLFLIKMGFGPQDAGLSLVCCSYILYIFNMFPFFDVALQVRLSKCDYNFLDIIFWGRKSIYNSNIYILSKHSHDLTAHAVALVYHLQFYSSMPTNFFGCF